MLNPLNLLALIASLLMSFGSTTLRFWKSFQSVSIAVSIVGIVLGVFCFRAAKARNHFVLCSAFTSHFRVWFVVLGFVAIGIPEFFFDTISQWRDNSRLAFIAADTICLTALLFLVWTYIRRRPNEPGAT